MSIFRSLISFLLFFTYLTSLFAQDSNNVDYSIFIEKSVPFGTLNTKISEGSFKEGSSFIIPEAELSGEFSIYQDLYNALVGGRFGIDYGALNHDIIMKFYIRKLNEETGTYQDLGQYQDTLFSYFEIRIWELPDSNFYPEKSSYYFNDGYYAHFSLLQNQPLALMPFKISWK